MSCTKYGYRIQQISEGIGYNWLFLPGGPGLGSEYLQSLCEQLNLSGSVYRVDFPMDGTNPKGTLDIEQWRLGLVDLLRSMPKVILVCHSFSAMFALLVPEIETELAGLVLMNTTTTNTFFEHIDAVQKKYSLPDLLPAASQYHLDPTDASYKAFWDSYKHYCFTHEELVEGENLQTLFTFNSAAYYYAIQHVFPNYQSQWYPTKIPAMTISSEFDYICPPKIFIEDQHYQAHNIINKMIFKAGHCPWLCAFDQVQQCFDAYSRLIEMD